MGISRLFGFCAALLFASSVTAANTIDLGPSDYRNWGTGSNTHTGAGIRSSTGQTVRIPPAGGNLSVTRNAVIPYGSIANGMRNFTRINPASAAASAAITALFLGLDWAFDDELDQWMKFGESTIEYVDPISGGYVSSGGGTYPTPAAACQSQWQCGLYGACIPQPDSSTSGTCVNAAGEGYGGWLVSSPICPAGSSYTPLGCEVVIEGEYEVLDSSDFQQLENFLPSADPNTVASAGNDVMRRQGAPLPGFQDQTITGPGSVSGSETTSTSTDPVTGDTVVTTTQTTTNISYGDTTITTTNTTTSNTYTNGTHTSTTTTTETPGELPVTETGGGGIAQLPPFCTWASIVCDWIGWTQEPPPEEPDLPQVIDDDFYEEKKIQFGVKTCPPDIEIMVPFINKVVYVPLQPFCDFAGLIYYLVMAAAYIIAAYITVGVVRNG